MTITITAFEASPDRGRGLARDTRVRWALEEVGQPYKVRLVSFAAMKQPSHLALHPFGQIPTYEEDDLALFETGAIILHIAQHDPGLLPNDAKARARAIMWMFAAVNTVEPPILELANAKILEHDKPWNADRLPILQDRVPKELELAGIEAANRFIREVYLPEHNALFAKPAEIAQSAFVPVADPVLIIEALCIEEDRTVSRDNTVGYQRLRLQLPPSPVRPHYVKAHVKVRQYPDATLAVFHGPRLLARYTKEGNLIEPNGLKAAA